MRDCYKSDKKVIWDEKVPARNPSVRNDKRKYVLQRPCWPDCNWAGDCDKKKEVSSKVLKKKTQQMN